MRDQNEQNDTQKKEQWSSLYSVCSRDKLSTKLVFLITLMQIKPHLAVEQRHCGIPDHLCLHTRRVCVIVTGSWQVPECSTLTLWFQWWGKPGSRWFWCSWQTCRCCLNPQFEQTGGWRCRCRHTLEHKHTHMFTQTYQLVSPYNILHCENII